MNHAHSHHQGHEGSMVDDFRRRFWISLALTIPVLATSETVQHLLGLRGVLALPGARYVEFGFASAVYFYGGWPFLTGLVAELRQKLPGMMTLVGLAISVAYLYSAAVVFGLSGAVFFWETATLIDIMLWVTGSRCVPCWALRGLSRSSCDCFPPRRTGCAPTDQPRTSLLRSFARKTWCWLNPARGFPRTARSPRAGRPSTRHC